jgi:hypothetical protein
VLLGQFVRKSLQKQGFSTRCMICVEATQNLLSEQISKLAKPTMLKDYQVNRAKLSMG